MGWSQSKEEQANSHNTIAIAKVENLSNQVESKLNFVAIGLIVIGVISIIIMCYFIRAKCKQCARSWVQKTVGNLPPTAIRIDGVPVAAQQRTFS